VLNSQHSKKKKKDTVVLVHLESWHSEGWGRRIKSSRSVWATHSETLSEEEDDHVTGQDRAKSSSQLDGKNTDQYNYAP
jgi:hypothetical protein